MRPVRLCVWNVAVKGGMHMAVYSTRMNAAIWTAALASLCALGATPAGAQVSTLEVKKPAAATHAYWTAATLVNAKPMMLPHVAVDLSKPGLLGAPAAGGLQAPSQPPTVNVLPDYSNALFVPRSIEPPLMVPNMFGTSSGYRFTSARLTVDAAAA